MKLYYAKCYMTLNGVFYHPGEVFEAEEADMGRYLALGAAEECAMSAEQVTAFAAVADGNEGLLPAAPETEDAPEADAVPEVDVMDGIAAPAAKKNGKKGDKKK